MCAKEKVCKRECDQYIKATCLDRVTEAQAKERKRIGIACPKCYSKMIVARVNGKRQKICTNCGVK